MNVIFLTLVQITNIEEKTIYHDLMLKFRDEGHQVYIVTPSERRMGLDTSLKESNGVKILNVKTLNIQKTNVVEKGIGTLLLERQYKSAIKKYIGDIRFDLITYSTPPITFTNVVKYLKKKNSQAITYLQLKDIFPQNAVDIGMFGEKSLFNWYFRRKEKALYKVSDFIGCMSPVNVQFVLEHNPEIEASRVEVAPNSIELREMKYEDGQEKAERYYIRKKLKLPEEKVPYCLQDFGNTNSASIPLAMVACKANELMNGSFECLACGFGVGLAWGSMRYWTDHMKAVVMCEY